MADTEFDWTEAGAVSGALDPDSIQAQEHADRYYELVRHMTTDVKKIAKSTGYSEQEIEEIKRFVFLEIHNLIGKKPKRFDASFEMAQSWQRLIDGKNIMIRLKNIHKSGGHIFCDAYVEDCAQPVALDLDTMSETLAEYRLPENYDYCTSHIAHAKWYLLSAEDPLPKEELIMWY